MRSALPFLPYRTPKVYDSVQEILPLLLDKGYKRVLLVTDKSIRALGLTLSLEQALQQKGIACAVYEDTCPNPTVQNVESARELYLKESYQCIIAFGGGSPMDCAKAVEIHNRKILADWERIFSCSAAGTGWGFHSFLPNLFQYVHNLFASPC